jgi:competence protein ComGC
VGPAAARRSALGLTLIEMMVAVGILSLLILAFSQILGTTQQVVSEAQDLMRSNAKASALEAVFRPDMEQVSQQGFLAIIQDRMISSSLSSPRGGRPFLVASLAGPTASKQTPLQAGSSILVYGLCENAADADADRRSWILYRQNWLLPGGLLPGNYPPARISDIWPQPVWPDEFNLLTSSEAVRNQHNQVVDLQTLRQLSYGDLGFLAEAAVSQGAARATYPASRVDDDGNPIPLRLPALNLRQVDQVWQVLANHCQALGILWTDGSLNAFGDLAWYGVDYVVNRDDEGGLVYETSGRYEGYPKVAYYERGKVESGDDHEAYWSTRRADEPSMGNTHIQFNRYGQLDSTGRFAYCAMWTHHNPDHWPVAIKFRFLLTGGGLPEEVADVVDGVDYEIICPLNR